MRSLVRAEDLSTERQTDNLLFASPEQGDTYGESMLAGVAIVLPIDAALALTLSN